MNHPYMDGRCWALYDINSSLQEVDKDNFNQEIREGRIAFGEHSLLKALLANEKFKQRFINTMMDLMNKNFRDDIILQRLKVLSDEIAISVELHSKRFSGNENSLREFYGDVATMEEFFRKRPRYVSKML